MLTVNESQKQSQENQIAEPKSQAELFSNKQHREDILLERTNLIERLNKSNEVRDVSDLYVDLPSELLYNPIFFRLHLPLSLQKPDYIALKSDNALVEDFECAYVGDVLLISALCDVDKEPFGIFDARDKIIKILEKLVKIEVIPPCLYSRPVTFAMKSEIKPQEELFSLFEITEATESKVLIRELHKMIGYELAAFYDISGLAKDVGELVDKIQYETSNLLRSIVRPSKKSWKRRLGFGTSERRKNIIDILGYVTECQYYNNLRKRHIKDFQMFWDIPPIAKVLHRRDLEFYGEPSQELDMDSILKSLELVRSELDSYTSNRVAILSALTGAVVGSIVTYILSQIWSIG